MGPVGWIWALNKEGFEIPLAIDFEESFIETHKFNFKKTRSIPADLTKLGPSGVLKLVNEELPKGTSIAVIGGPPCQGFSRSNPNSDVNDPRNLLPSLYIQIIKELQRQYKVEFVVFENVLGMKDKKHEDKYNALIAGLGELGFNVNEKELCALDFGVPQKRHRVIISAMRKNKGYTDVIPVKRKGKSTVQEAIGGLQDPAFFDSKLNPSDIPLHPNHWTMKPKSHRFSSSEFVDTKTRSFRRLKWDKASPTIAFGNREIHIHPEGKRRLSIYEAMLLQGFSPNFVLKGNLSQQVTQVSNAVPPPLARGIAAGVKRSLQIN